VVEPENRYILQAWAVAELRGSNVEKARSLLHQCLELDAECRAALHALGQLELNHGSLKQARALFMQLLDLEPKTKNQQLEACSALAGLESKAKNFQKAEIWCDRALGLDKNHVLTLKTLAWIKKSQNKVNEAEELYWKIDKIKSRLRRK
jgi:tetratricopeptide (TPR) repeat protein